MNCEVSVLDQSIRHSDLKSNYLQAILVCYQLWSDGISYRWYAFGAIVIYCLESTNIEFGTWEQFPTYEEKCAVLNPRNFHYHMESFAAWERRSKHSSRNFVPGDVAEPSPVHGRYHILTKITNG